MLTKDFDYSLPEELIAQVPPQIRGTSRMMILDRKSSDFEHKSIADICNYLRKGDLLIMNNTRVFPARLFGEWQDTHGSAEILLTQNEEPEKKDAENKWSSVWRCLCGSGRKQRIGNFISFANGKIIAEVLDKDEAGNSAMRFSSDEPLMDLLEKFGKVPVPPYIHREKTHDLFAGMDKERYQTVYASETGAVAAPTAGLHFTKTILDDLKNRGIEEAYITLHVGPGTFKPVTAETVEGHQMEAEFYNIPQETATAIEKCKARGGRVIAVGSTSVRTLETVATLNNGHVIATHGKSSIFIFPPYKFKVVDAMLTNFHLPQSTLIMMVSALAGRDKILNAYKEAVAERYRFFSYGDCMLIL